MSQTLPEEPAERVPQTPEPSLVRKARYVACFHRLPRDGTPVELLPPTGCNSVIEGWLTAHSSQAIDNEWGYSDSTSVDAHQELVPGLITIWSRESWSGT